MGDVHHEDFQVRSYDIDASGRLSPRALCAFLQEAAGRDAERLGAGSRRLADAGLAWVLQRLQLEVARLPALAERVRVLTWPRRFDRVLALRDFELRGEGDTLLACASSRWAIVDLEARRAVRLPAFVRSLPVPERPPALDGDTPLLHAPRREDVSRRFEVRYGDLDTNHHVNNTRYVEWCLETVPDELLDSHRPVRLEIAFRQESVYGDVVFSRAERLSEPPELSFAHRLERAADGAELVLALSRWRPRPS